MSVVVFGSINIDITAYMERLPKPGETLDVSPDELQGMPQA